MIEWIAARLQVVLQVEIICCIENCARDGRFKFKRACQASPYSTFGKESQARTVSRSRSVSVSKVSITVEVVRLLFQDGLSSGEGGGLSRCQATGWEIWAGSCSGTVSWFRLFSSDRDSDDDLSESDGDFACQSRDNHSDVKLVHGLPVSTSGTVSAYLKALWVRLSLTDLLLLQII